MDHQGTITEVSSVASEFNEELQLMVNSRVSALRNTNFELTPVLDHLPTFQILPAQYQVSDFVNLYSEISACFYLYSIHCI